METSKTIIILIAVVTVLLTTLHEADSLGVMARHVGKKKREQSLALKKHQLPRFYRSRTKSNKVKAFKPSESSKYLSAEFLTNRMLR